MGVQQTTGDNRYLSRSAEHVPPEDALRLDPQLVHQQLERILASSEYAGPDRTRRFLRYVVEETLAGRGDRIKAYSVAVAAFDRDESFDPQNDPIVRIEAARVRRSLERYYLTAGAADPLRIEIPRGTYVPTFSWAEVTPTEAPHDEVHVEPLEPKASQADHAPASRTVNYRDWAFALSTVLALLIALVVALAGSDEEPASSDTAPSLPHPSVAVVQLVATNPDQQVSRLAGSITNEIVRELSRFPSVFVIGPAALKRFGEAPDVIVIGRGAGADFVLSGEILLSGDRLRASVNLSDARTGGIIWAEVYDRTFTIDRLFDVEADIARDIVRQIGQPQGAIALFDWKRTRGMAPDDWEAYDCVVQADELHRRIAPPESVREVLRCLRTVTKEEPGYADAWILLSLIEIDAFRFAPLARLPDDAPDQALAAAMRAVDLAPDNGRAHLALMSALAFQGKTEAALVAGEVAVRLSPHDSDLLAEVGLRHVVTGDNSAGLRLLNDAVRHSPTVPPSYQLSLSLAHLRDGRYQDASDAVAALPPSENFVHLAIVASVLGNSGELDAARDAAEDLLAAYPNFEDWAWLELERRSTVPELAAALVNGWRAAGLSIPPPPPGTDLR